MISTFAVLEPSRTVIVTALTGPLVTPPLSVQVGGVPVGVGLVTGISTDATRLASSRCGRPAPIVRDVPAIVTDRGMRAAPERLHLLVGEGAGIVVLARPVDRDRCRS